MTTDNTVQENPERAPRPVEELLKMDSYADMTDEEVESVIALKCKWAYNDGLRETVKQENATRNETYTSALDELHAQAQSLFEALQEVKPDLQVVNYGTEE